MKNPILAPEFKELIDRNSFKILNEFCEEYHPAETAEILNSLRTDDVWKTLKNISLVRRTEFFSQLDLDLQTEITDLIDRKELISLLTEMSADDRVD